MNTPKKEFHTENLKHGGISWSVEFNKASLYNGIDENGKWKKVLDFYYDNVSEFYDSVLYKQIINRQTIEKYITKGETI